ncbi:MAG: amidase family protein [Mycobacteriales bacterium]
MLTVPRRPWSLVDEVGDPAERTSALIDALDPEIRAFLAEPGRRHRLRREIADGIAGGGRLAGVPVGIKDIIRVDGFTTRAGSQLPPKLFAGLEAAVVRRVRAAGGAIAGKTVTAEFASTAPGDTRNPHHLGHTPGGSSSGSAAAVAAGMVPLAIGSQTAGSVIRPAAYCGVVGFKPSRGRIPIEGTIPNAPSFDVLGTFTADVAGAAVAGAALCDGWQPHPDTQPIIGVPVGDYLDRTDPSALEAFRRTAKALQEQGFAVTDVPAFTAVATDTADAIDRVIARHRAVNGYEFAQMHADWFDRFGPLYRPATAAAIERGRRVSAESYRRAYDECTGFGARTVEVMRAAGIDIWLTPAATGPAPVGLAGTGDPSMNLPWTQADLPALTLPAGTLGLLPLGVQLVGRSGADEALIGYAAAVESVLRRSAAP